MTTESPPRKGKSRASSGPAERRTATRARREPAAAGPERRSRGSHAANLVVVESPTKARTVKNILGDDYEVIASIGHVRDLPPYGYGVESVEKLDFRPKYVVVKDKRRGVDKSEVVADIAKAAKKATRVFLSTDPDREGEAIAWHIKEAAGIPDEKVTRVVFHEITRPAIEAAFEEATGHHVRGSADHGRKVPGKIDMDLVDAQQARRVLDRLIGFPLTWFVQKKVSRGASAGRVQSVALGLIVKREKEIQGFTAVEYWSIHAGLAKSGRPFEAELANFPAMTKGASMRPPFRAAGPAIPNESTASGLSASFGRSEFAVASVVRGEKKRGPVPPFTTSTFQQAAVNRLGMSAARAMGVAQELYEGIAGQGLITYMRTDSVSISPIARRQAREWVTAQWGADYTPEKERVYATRSKGAQEAHEAIRPTNPSATPESLRRSLSADQHRVYQLIWQRFVASQMSDARYATMQVEIAAREAGTVVGTFRASASTLIFEGHLKAYGADVNDSPVQADDEQEGQAVALPELVEGEVLERRSIEPRRHQTEPPPRYTEATLVRALEDEGIGRPSTYASIVQTVLKRDYVEKQGRALVPQELGFIVHDLLEQHMKKYVDVPFTGEMEKELDEVASGDREYDSVLKAFWPEFKGQLDSAESAAEKQQEETEIRCNVCDQANLVIKWGRNGKFFACPRYPECTNSLPMGPDGQPVFVAAPKEIGYRCPKDGGVLVQKTGPYGQYVDCVNRESGACDFRAGVPIGVACPEEPDTGQLVQKQTKRGIFYGCWNYPNCSYTTNSLEPGKLAPARPLPEREEANRKLIERSARGKAAFAKRKANSATRARRAS